jgi:hypothetical protein
VYEDAGGGYLVDVLGLDFQVVDWFLGLAGCDVCYLGCAVSGSEAFGWFEVFGLDEGLAVFGPEEVVGGAAYCLSIRQVDVYGGGGLVVEGACYDGALAGLD